MDNAKNFGYEFKILWGYTFKKAKIFGLFILYLYKLRITYPKGHPLNYIAKILLNSFFGRFRMDDSFSEIKLIAKTEYLKWESKVNVESIIDILIRIK